MIDLIHINHQSEIPKYAQITSAITDAISNKVLEKGSTLPSVNSICRTHNLSRDTVFKAYGILKDQGIIESVPNKGYYVAQATKKVLLILDTFKAYKEVLYHAFVNSVPANIIVDVQFHHYNMENFKTMINNSVGKYYKYIIMNFDHYKISQSISKLPSDKLLIIDWNIHTKAEHNYVAQNFDTAFFNGLYEAKTLLSKYEKIEFVYPSFTNHPIDTLKSFKRFCKENHFRSKVLTDPKNLQVESKTAYISVSDRMLGRILDQCRIQNFEIGKDIGILSYNDTPMKKFIDKGISVISTDFKELGSMAASFVTEDIRIKHYVPTKFIQRASL